MVKATKSAFTTTQGINELSNDAIKRPKPKEPTRNVSMVIPLNIIKMDMLFFGYSNAMDAANYSKKPKPDINPLSFSVN